MREVFIEKNDNKVFCDVIELGGMRYNFLEFIKMPIPDALQKIKQLQIPVNEILMPMLLLGLPGILKSYHQPEFPML